ncbi:hypothetical protein [Micromonospora saelicesensis]|nr:hypothetical protein [Micromonospora saelicesensis]
MTPVSQGYTASLWLALTDALVSGEVDSIDELALRLSPYLEMSS